MSPDLWEWLGILVAIPIAFVFGILAVASTAVVFFDARERWRSTPVADPRALGVWLYGWPLSFFGYVFAAAYLDNQRLFER